MHFGRQKPLVIYFDTSYLLKCYITEHGSREVQKLAVEKQHITCCVYGKMELLAAFHRKLREKEIDKDTHDILLRQFDLDEEQGLWKWIPMTATLIDSVTQIFHELPRNVYLRTADGLHLTCARDNGFREIFSNDRHLLEAAVYFNLDSRNIIG